MYLSPLWHGNRHFTGFSAFCPAVKKHFENEERVPSFDNKRILLFLFGIPKRNQQTLTYSIQQIIENFDTEVFLKDLKKMFDFQISIRRCNIETKSSRI